MICPHCKKAIPVGLNYKAKTRIMKLKEAGYSVREIEKILFAEGFQASFSTIARYLREIKGWETNHEP